MTIYVCIGSSCHLKGSYEIINLLKQGIESNGLTGKVELTASFCLGHCTNGVTIKVDDEIVTGVSVENFDAVFEKHVLCAFA